MNREFSRARRFAVAAAALFCAGFLFRSQIADALVIRGDEYLYRGDEAQALERYRRALAFDPSLPAAADRYVFVSLRHQTPASLEAALDTAQRYLKSNPTDAAVLSDRALCYVHLRKYGAAERDFESAANISHAPSDYVFAGWAAEHIGRERHASFLWRQALRVRPGYAPALQALTEHRV